MSKIIDFKKFHKKTIPSTEKLEPSVRACEKIMTNTVGILDSGGYDIRDPDLLHDLEVITTLILALIHRQEGKQDNNIDSLDNLRGRNFEDT